MPPNIFMLPAIRSSRAMIRRKAGAGATSTRYGSISPTAPRRSLARFHATLDIKLKSAQGLGLDSSGDLSSLRSVIASCSISREPSQHQGRRLAASIPNARFVALDSENHALLAPSVPGEIRARNGG